MAELELIDDSKEEDQSSVESNDSGDDSSTLAPSTKYSVTTSTASNNKNANENDNAVQLAEPSGDKMNNNASSSSKEGKNKRQVLEECNLLVQEYLQRNQLVRTCKEFQKECSELQLPLPKIISENTAIVSSTTVNTLLQAFDQINKQQFFQVWDDPQKLPHERSSKVFMRLNFKLHVYFAIKVIEADPTCIETDTPSLTDTWKQVREYLELEGNRLAEEQEFLHYYALPYTRNPASHPTFQSLFQEQWSAKLRSDLQDYLQSIREVCGESLLCRVVAVQCQELAGVQYTKLLHQYSTLREEHAKLIGVTTELTAGLEELARASLNPKSDPHDNRRKWIKMIDRCNSAFPELFSGPEPPPPTWSQKRALRNCEENSKSGDSSSSAEEFEEDSYVKVVDCLDSSLVIDELQGHHTRTKLLLLQALRWMVTKTDPEERLKIVARFLKIDIIGLHTIQVREKLMNCFASQPHMPMLMQQSLARLFNALASTGSGRKYLAEHISIVDAIVEALISTHKLMESVTIEMLVATLQKLSLRYDIRRRLIQKGLIGWMGGVYLPGWEDHREYALEYTTALLMNLCLHKSLKVEDRLVELSQTSDEEIKQQLDYILEMVQVEQLPPQDANQDISDDENEEGSEEDIEVEAEIEERDPVVCRPDEVAGLKLLSTRFLKAEKAAPPVVHEVVDDRPIKPAANGDYAFADIKEEDVNEEESKAEEKDNVSVEKEATSHKSLKEDKEKQKGKDEIEQSTKEEKPDNKDLGKTFVKPIDIKTELKEVEAELNSLKNDSSDPNKKSEIAKYLDKLKQDSKDKHTKDEDDSKVNETLDVVSSQESSDLTKETTEEVSAEEPTNEKEETIMNEEPITEPTSPSKKGEVFVIDFNDGNNASPKKTPKRFQITKSKKKRYSFDKEEDECLEQTVIKEADENLDNNLDEGNENHFGDTIIIAEENDLGETNEKSLESISESSVELPKLKAINSPRHCKSDKNKKAKPLETDGDSLNRRNDTYIKGKEMVEYNNSKTKEGEHKKKVKKGDLIIVDIKNTASENSIDANDLNTAEEDNEIKTGEIPQECDNFNKTKLKLNSTFKIRENNDQIDVKCELENKDTKEESGQKPKTSKKVKVRKSKKDSPKESIETEDKKEESTGVGVEYEQKSSSKDKKERKSRKIKEEIDDCIVDHENYEVSKQNLVPETPAKSSKKHKNSKSPIKTKLPMLEQRRRRVMDKLMEIDAAGGCTSHRPSLNNHDCDDVIFITEEFTSAGQKSHSSMALMSSKSATDGALSPPMSSPREVPYSALSEPGPTLFEDILDYSGKKLSRSSARKHRRHRTMSASKAKILLDSDAVESCDSGISLSDNGRNSDEPRIESGHYNLETSPSAPASARRIRPQQSSSGEQLSSGRRERRTLSSYQYRSSQTEIRMKSQTSGQDVPTSPEKPRTRRKGSLSSPALNRGFELRKIARSARTRSMNARQAAASGGQQELFSTQPTPGSARKLRPQTGVEDVLSNLDRCSYSALNDMDAGYHVRYSKSPEKSLANEGKTISMDFRYTPLSQLDCELAMRAPTPRKCWRRAPTTTLPNINKSSSIDNLYYNFNHKY